MYFTGTQPYVLTGDPANPSHVAFRCRVTTSPEVSAISNPDILLLSATSDGSDPGGGCLTLTGNKDGEVCLANVRGTNYCDIAVDYVPDTETVVVMAALDNMLKGACSQAIQNLNLLCGLDESAGIGGVRGS